MYLGSRSRRWSNISLDKPLVFGCILTSMSTSRYNFCAAAAAYALDVKGLDWVVILDWDAHHGNGVAAYADEEPRVAYASAHQAVSTKPRETSTFSDFGGLYLGRISVDSAPSWTVDHLCTSSRDLDKKVARIDSYKVILK